MTLDADHSAFIQSGVAIDVAGRDSHNVPVVARAVACRVSAERQHVTLFVPRAFGARCLNAIAATGAVAAVFCHPRTLRAIQLKGVDASIVPVTDDDLSHVRAATMAFVADVVSLGHSEPVALTDVSYAPADLVGVTFSPHAAFVQTPGPSAGARI
jgi:hypothetical protein